MASDDTPKGSRIGIASMVMMPAVALFFDLISFIPFVGALAWVVFTFWLHLLGVELWSARKFATMGTSTIMELIPVLSVLPTVTIGIIAIIIMVKFEERTGIKIPSLKPK
jgi:hypothetical protein